MVQGQVLTLALKDHLVVFLAMPEVKSLVVFRTLSFSS